MTSSFLFCENCGAATSPEKPSCYACGQALTPASTQVPSLAGTDLLPMQTLLRHRYRFLHPLGKGGMGAVYKAEDTQLGNRLVAVKEMSQTSLYPQEVADAAENFKHEAHLLAKLGDPNLPSIYDYFGDQGRWYLVMSYIEGETLQQYLDRRGGKLPVEETVQITMTLCSVLEYLHTHQPPIIFRDIKPSNIMRTPSGQIYLIDFGIARHFKPGQAKDTANYGSAGYAPPEQYGRAQTTPRSDIYSLGATLHQLLSGHDPSSSPFRFPTLSSLRITLPNGLEALIIRMLDVDANTRPSSMKEVKQELGRIAAPAPSVARTVLAKENAQEVPLRDQFHPPTQPVYRTSSPPHQQTKSFGKLLLLVLGTISALLLITLSFGLLVDGVWAIQHSTGDPSGPLVSGIVILLPGLFIFHKCAPPALGKWVGGSVSFVGTLLFLSELLFARGGGAPAGVILLLVGALLFLVTRKRNKATFTQPR